MSWAQRLLEEDLKGKQNEKDNKSQGDSTTETGKGMSLSGSGYKPMFGVDPTPIGTGTIINIPPQTTFGTTASTKLGAPFGMPSGSFPAFGMGRGSGGSPMQQPGYHGPAKLSINKFINPNPSAPTSNEEHEQSMPPAEIALLNKYLHKEVKMMKDAKVDVQRNDPNSPLYSISSFRAMRLKPELLNALDALGFEFPTKIQETALPLLLMEPKSNLIAQAQSGTGKTASFVLAMLSRTDVNEKCAQCICLAPTIELAKQIEKVIESMSQFMTGLKILCATRGHAWRDVVTEQIVVGTPGTIRDYLIKRRVIDPSKIKCLVLDEADVMIYQQGFKDISTNIYRLVQENSPEVQSMLFSATYDDPVVDFATKLVKNAVVVMLKKEEQALPNIKQFFVKCPSRESKFAAIVDLYSGLTIASSVIFCHSKNSVDWVAINLQNRGNEVGVLHGNMDVEDRAQMILNFKNGVFKVLITTNVFSRGIDVSQVSVVINYDLPIKYGGDGAPVEINGVRQVDSETYLHRIGRTGRFGKSGIAINLIDKDSELEMIHTLENHYQMKIHQLDPKNIDMLENIQND